MAKSRKHPDYVKHPRYGSHPIPSGNNIAENAIKGAHWRYSSLKFFPETAIMANTSKQNYSIYPRSIYVDIEEMCEVCKKPFIFFAREQQYWFEVLGFWIDAHCTRCYNCRKKDQEIRLMQKHYQTLLAQEPKSSSENTALKQIAMELYQLGYIRDINKIEIK